MKVLSGPQHSTNPMIKQVLQDQKATQAEGDPKYFHPQGRDHFHQDHGFPHPGLITPYEEALHKFQQKQRGVREAALKKSLNVKMGAHHV